MIMVRRLPGCWDYRKISPSPKSSKTVPGSKFRPILFILLLTSWIIPSTCQGFDGILEQFVPISRFKALSLEACEDTRTALIANSATNNPDPCIESEYRKVLVALKSDLYSLRVLALFQATLASLDVTTFVPYVSDDALDDDAIAAKVEALLRFGIFSQTPPMNVFGLTRDLVVLICERGEPVDAPADISISNGSILGTVLSWLKAKYNPFSYDKIRVNGREYAYGKIRGGTPLKVVQAVSRLTSGINWLARKLKVIPYLSKLGKFLGLTTKPIKESLEAIDNKLRELCPDESDRGIDSKYQKFQDAMSQLSILRSVLQNVMGLVERRLAAIDKKYIDSISYKDLLAKVENEVPCSIVFDDLPDIIGQPFAKAQYYEEKADLVASWIDEIDQAGSSNNCRREEPSNFYLEIDEFNAFVDFVDDFRRAIKAIYDNIGAIFDPLTSTFESLIQPIFIDVPNALEKMVNGFADFMNFVKPINDLLSPLPDLIPEPPWPFGSIGDIMEDIVCAVINPFGKLTLGIDDLCDYLEERLGEFFSDIIEEAGLGDIPDPEDLFGGVAGLLSDLGDIIDQIDVDLNTDIFDFSSLLPDDLQANFAKYFRFDENLSLEGLLLPLLNTPGSILLKYREPIQDESGSTTVQAYAVDSTRIDINCHPNSTPIITQILFHVGDCLEEIAPGPVRFPCPGLNTTCEIDLADRISSCVIPPKDEFLNVYLGFPQTNLDVTYRCMDDSAEWKIAPDLFEGESTAHISQLDHLDSAFCPAEAEDLTDAFQRIGLGVTGVTSTPMDCSTGNRYIYIDYIEEYYDPCMAGQSFNLTSQPNREGMTDLCGYKILFDSGLVEGCYDYFHFGYDPYRYAGYELCEYYEETDPYFIENCASIDVELQWLFSETEREKRQGQTFEGQKRLGPLAKNSIDGTILSFHKRICWEHPDDMQCFVNIGEDDDICFPRKNWVLDWESIASNLERCEVNYKFNWNFDEYYRDSVFQCHDFFFDQPDGCPFCYHGDASVAGCCEDFDGNFCSDDCPFNVCKDAADYFGCCDENFGEPRDLTCGYRSDICREEPLRNPTCQNADMLEMSLCPFWNYLGQRITDGACVYQQGSYSCFGVDGVPYIFEASADPVFVNQDSNCGFLRFDNTYSRFVDCQIRDETESQFELYNGASLSRSRKNPYEDWKSAFDTLQQECKGTEVSPGKIEECIHSPDRKCNFAEVGCIPPQFLWCCYFKPEKEGVERNYLFDQNYIGPQAKSITCPSQIVQLDGIPVEIWLELQINSILEGVLFEWTDISVSAIEYCNLGPGVSSCTFVPGTNNGFPTNGRVWEIDSECKCPAGFLREPEGGICIPCPPGHERQNGFETCTSCPPGSYAGAGSPSCTLCNPGYIQPLQSSTACNGCSPGTFSADPGQSSCELCPVGSYQNASSQSGCIVVEPGYYQPDHGSVIGLRCPAGSYSNGNSTECLPCPSGTFSTNGSPNECDPCPLGTYSLLEGSKKCFFCPQGYYSSTEAATACTRCDDGLYTNGKGATSQSECIPPVDPELLTQILDDGDSDEFNLDSYEVLPDNGVPNRTISEVSIGCRMLLEKYVLGLHDETALNASLLEIGDGYCNRGPWNTRACGWDGGDCCAQTCNPTQFSDPDDDDPERSGRLVGRCFWRRFQCLQPDLPSTIPSQCDTSQSDTIVIRNLVDGKYQEDSSWSASRVSFLGDWEGRKSSYLSRRLNEVDPELGDGVCNPSLNNELHMFDGGDCCPSTCIPNPQYDGESCVEQSFFGTPLKGCEEGYGCCDPLVANMSFSATDVVPPTIQVVPDYLVECGLIPPKLLSSETNPYSVTVTDNDPCFIGDSNLTFSSEIIDSQEPFPCSGSVARISHHFEAADLAGNIGTGVINAYVTDSIPPTFSCNTYLEFEMDQELTIYLPEIVASDICSGDVPVLYHTEANTVNLTESGELTISEADEDLSLNVTASATDRCGNVAECTILLRLFRTSTSPSGAPTLSGRPSFSPTSSGAPSASPSTSPSRSSMPSLHPSSAPSNVPSSSPSIGPTISSLPSSEPSGIPSSDPSSGPSNAPSGSILPSIGPSSSPSLSSGPSLSPSSLPSTDPTPKQTSEPSLSALPSASPSSSPSASNIPSTSPSETPTGSSEPSSSQTSNNAPVVDLMGPFVIFVDGAVGASSSNGVLSVTAHDPEGHEMTYSWTTTCGSSAVLLNDDSSEAHLSFPVGTVPKICFVQVEVCDAYLLCAPVEEAIVAVVDPAAGFITGGGWIQSPLGGHSQGLPTEGKASFGFVSKIHESQNLPSGNTQFTFHADDFKFSSTAYEWLVINVDNDCAKYKGVGIVGEAEEPDHDFMVTTCDGDAFNTEDTFRIKIWPIGDETSSDPIYDNQRGVSDDDYDGTPLGGGNIKIHQLGGSPAPKK